MGFLLLFAYVLPVEEVPRLCGHHFLISLKNIEERLNHATLMFSPSLSASPGATHEGQHEGSQQHGPHQD